MDEMTYDLKPARKTFSRIGLSLFIIPVIATVLQALWFGLSRGIWGEDHWMIASSWGMWIGTFAPMYCVAIPVALLMLRELPAQVPQDNKLGAGNFWVFLLISMCLMYGGNLIGSFLSAVLSGGKAQNAISDYAMDTNPLKILVMVILAPLLEEYVCRKQIIDRTRQYGEKTAVFLSALAFGLLHQNLFQFFYAFGVGLVLAYIYTRTGRLRYTVLLHGILNFMGSVVAPFILTQLNMDTLANMDPNAPMEELMPIYAEILPGLILFLLYILILLGASIAGFVLLIIKCRHLTWHNAEAQLPKGTAVKTVYLNVGMILYVLLCLVSFIFALFL